METGIKTSLIVILIVFGIFFGCAGTSGKSIKCFENTREAEVNNIPLKHTNSAEIEDIFNATCFEYEDSITEIILTGSSDKKCFFKVEYYEYEPDDATLLFTENTLSYKTKSGKPVLIASIDGTIPNDIDLLLSTSSGDIIVSGMMNPDKLDFRSSSGDIILKDTQYCNYYHVRTSNGDIILKNVHHSRELNLASANGDMILEQVTDFGNIQLAIANGDFILKESDGETLKGSFANGDVILVGSIINNLIASFATGDIIKDRTSVINNQVITKAGKIIQIEEIIDAH
ncbi:MAG: DUF4097 domain-containing protein [Candidatus Cloacimonetes bacterium]|nr:DUF4097 domain-containing protein [Candidatus Cloacimonadota bacterium]